MTEQRKKYLDNISKEEQAIRKQLRYYHREIVGSKWNLKYYKNKDVPWVINEVQENIRNYKTIIKALKKQLSAPRKAYQNEYLDYCLCPICRWYANHHTSYCSKCGQKLR